MELTPAIYVQTPHFDTLLNESVKLSRVQTGNRHKWSSDVEVNSARCMVQVDSREARVEESNAVRRREREWNVCVDDKHFRTVAFEE